QNLDEAVAQGRFRQDLLYRLNGFTVRLPPLRERRGDIPSLVEHFIRLCNRELGRQVHAASAETLGLLEAHDWPGNIRELLSTIRYAVVNAPGEILTPACLPEQFRGGPSPTRAAQAAEEAALNLAGFVLGLIQSGTPDVYRRVCLEVDRAVMDTVLR